MGSVNWHPNSAYVVTGSSDKTCRLFDIHQGSAEDSTVHVYDINSAKTHQIV